MPSIAAIMSVSANCYYESKTIAVREILAAQGWSVETEVEEVWSGFTAKIRWAHKCARELTQYTHLMLIDARDVVVLGRPGDILARFKAFDHPWVFNAEPHIWPRDMAEPEDFPPCEGPYRYLNSGAFIAEREHMLDCFERWPLKGDQFAHIIARGEDGPVYTERYLFEPGCIKLDHQCELFQCMCGSDWLCNVTPGQVHNIQTKTHPRIIHFNGGTDITVPDRRELWEHLV